MNTTHIGLPELDPEDSFMSTTVYSKLAENQKGIIGQQAQICLDSLIHGLPRIMRGCGFAGPFETSLNRYRIRGPLGSPSRLPARPPLPELEKSGSLFDHGELAPM
jgi:hypothetical protein